MEQKPANIQKRALNIHRELRESTFKLARIIKTLFQYNLVFKIFAKYCMWFHCVQYFIASEGVTCGKREKTTSAFKWLNCHTGFLRKKERVEILL